jgi:hypothetical protein
MTVYSPVQEHSACMHAPSSGTALQQPCMYNNYRIKKLINEDLNLKVLKWYFLLSCALGGN